MSFLSKLLGGMSGKNTGEISNQLIFNKVIGFRGTVSGVGTSTIVQSVAHEIALRTKLSVCVLDTNYLTTVSYPMFKKGVEEKRLDYLDYDGVLSDVATPTDFSNVVLFSLNKRTIVDMLSSKDSDITVNRILEDLKSYFDIILIDLSVEPTNLSTFSSIKCNKIYHVTEQSLRAVYHLQRTLNHMATLAVPLGKANKIILNKTVPDVITNTKSVIAEAGLTLIGEIPLSTEIAKQGVAGKLVYDDKTVSQEVLEFNKVIETILDDILEVTPANAEQLGKNVKEDKRRLEKLRERNQRTIKNENLATNEEEMNLGVVDKLSDIGVKRDLETKPTLPTVENTVDKEIEEEIELDLEELYGSEENK